MVMENFLDCVSSLQDIPWYVLSKLFMLDYRGRDDIFPKNKTHMYTGGMREPNLDEFFDGLLDSNLTPVSSALHPTDALVAIFYCSSEFLRQVLCEKMFMCKLAIPLVLPEFMNNSSTFLIWSLRNILLQNKKSNKEVIEISLSNFPHKIVSCLRMGDIFRSKSKFLNEILNGQSHNTFYHRDCENGMQRRTLSNGLLEIAWYLPSTGKISDNALNEIVGFINSRGATDFSSINGKFLLGISDVILVLVDTTCFDNPSIVSSLQSIALKSKPVLMISKNPAKELHENCKVTMKKCLKEIKYKSLILDIAHSGERNVKDLKLEAVTKISQLLEDNKYGNILEKHRLFAESLGIEVDGKSSEITKNGEVVRQLVQVLKEGGADLSKRRVLPMQCEPWHEWVKDNKEEHRLVRKPKKGESLHNYTARLNKNKYTKRKIQLESLENPSMFFSMFLENLLKKREYDRLCFLKWLKLYLDDMSRDIIPDLQKEYSEKWDEKSRYTENEVPLYVKEELKVLETRIADASFGMEHVMREICQAYEIVAELGDEVSVVMQEQINQLPKIMAELLLQGYPLELMDGDASHVPVVWVKAVLRELQELIGNEKRIFVLSVLGIQSSGKSTLLNTMFGLQFAVGAGRCTRGVYAQMIPVSKHYRELQYDYILVLDTEGLRATELASIKHQHDNEIATFAVGLGDVTIINIKGENVAEIQDVLQIVIHALLKMRLVNKSLKLQPSCLFIHQNVGAQDAAQKMKTGQQKFMETLDKVTKIAGELEDKPQFCKVKEVIDIDIHKNVWYFSDLWKGDPPMSPANPGYSEKVNAVKNLLFLEIMKNRSVSLNVQKLSQKLCDLWNAILKENFVFSFKNSLEISSYRTLEKKHSDLSWSLKNSALKWLNKKINVIQSHDKDLDKLKDHLLKESDSQLQKEHARYENEITDFFECNEEKEVFEQWRHSTLLRFKETKEEILKSTKNRLQNAIKRREKEICHTEDLEKYKEAMQAEVTQWAETTKKDKKEICLESQFDEIWNNCANRLFANSDRDETNIYESMKNVLLSEFHMDQPLLIEVLEHYLMEKINANVITAIKQHIVRPALKKRVAVATSRPTNSFHNKKELMSGQKGNILDEERKLAKAFIDIVQEKTKMDAHKVGAQGMTLDYAESFIKWTINEANKMETAKVKFEPAESFQAHMCVYACQIGSYEFAKISEKPMVNNNVEMSCKLDDINVLTDLKDSLHKMFPEQINLMSELLASCSTPLSGHITDFCQDVSVHISEEENVGRNRVKQGFAVITANIYVKNLLNEIRNYTESLEVVPFKDEYIIHIIKAIEKMVKKAEASKVQLIFKKRFKMEISVHSCLYALPSLFEKHRLFIESTDPSLIFKRDYKVIFLEKFKSICCDQKTEKSLADIVSRHLSNAIAKAVGKDMPRTLAEHVRENVPEVKSKATLLPAVLSSLLDAPEFYQFYKFLTDCEAFLDRWIMKYINDYLFTADKRDNTPYKMIASEQIKSLILRVCEEMEIVTEITLKKADAGNAFYSWIEELQKRVMGEVTLSENYLLSLTNGYTVKDWKAFTKILESNLDGSYRKLYDIFSKHSAKDLCNAQGETVYSLISQECRGCTEKCPFCQAPCSLSMKGHVSHGINHMAIEHYPLACAGTKWSDTNKLLIENCTALVASDEDFANEDTEFEAHAYRAYKKLYPDWEILGDATLESSLYWKRFLVIYASELSEEYGAETPGIPDIWREITVTRAKESLKHIN